MTTTISTPDPRFGFTVRIDTDDLDYGHVTRAKWDAERHRYIEVASSLQRTSDHGLPPGELFAVYRWCAGVLARLVLRVHEDIKAMAEKRGHRCSLDSYVSCGYSYGDYVFDPLRAVTGTPFKDGVMEPSNPPLVSFTVPTEQADRWVKFFQRILAEMLAEDMTVLDPPFPSTHDHSSVVIEAPSSQPRRTDA